METTNKNNFDLQGFYKKFELNCITSYDQLKEILRNTHSRAYILGSLTRIVEDTGKLLNFYPNPKGIWTALFIVGDDYINSNTKLHEYTGRSSVITLMEVLLCEETDQCIRLRIQSTFHTALDILHEADMSTFDTDRCKAAVLTAIDTLTEIVSNSNLTASEGVCSCLLSEDALKLKRNGIIAQRALDEIQDNAVLLGKYY